MQSLQKGQGWHPAWKDMKFQSGWEGGERALQEVRQRVQRPRGRSKTEHKPGPYRRWILEGRSWAS